MKNKFIIIFIILFSSSNFSQINNEGLISSSDLLKVYFLNGYGIIYQLDETQISSFRMQLDLSFDSNDLSLDRKTSNKLGTITESSLEEDEEVMFFKIQFSPQYYLNLFSKKHFVLYSGIGPLFSFSLSKQDNSSFSTNSTDFITRADNTKYEFGALLFLGIESSINNHLGIFSEIEFAGGKNWTNYDRKFGQSYPPEPISNFITESSEESFYYKLSKIRLGIYIKI